MISLDTYNSYEQLKDIKKVLKQFEGGTIGTPAPGCIHDVIIRSLIQDLDISVINYPWADFIPDALVRGEIQAGVGTPSLATVAGRYLNSKITIKPHMLWPYNPSYGIIVQNNLIGDDSNFILNFLKAHELACNFIREYPLKAAKISSKELGNIDEDFVLKTYKASPKYCASLPSEYVDSTLNFIPVLKKLGYLQNDLKIEDIFDFQFIKQIHPEPSHYDQIPAGLSSEK